MGRGIPDVVPSEIDDLLYNGWGDMKSFATSIGLPYTAVYSALCRNNHKTVARIIALAEVLEISPDRLAKILLIPNLNERQAAIDLLLNGMSRSEWARRAGTGVSYVQALTTNLEQSHLSNVINIVDGLGLDLKRFCQAYKWRKSIAS